MKKRDVSDGIPLCKLCRAMIPAWSRSDRRYCSSFCRKKAYDLRHGRISSDKAGFSGVAVGIQGE